MQGATFTYTTSDEAKLRRVEEKLRAAGVRCETTQTRPKTFEVEGEEVTVGSARPWNITVARKHQGTLERFVREDKPEV